MKLINSSYEIIPQEPGILGVYKQIEKAARTAYKSEDKITDNSAKRMVDALCKQNHGACLEHGTVYLKTDNIELWDHYYFDPYSILYEVEDNAFYITTNARVVFENEWLDDLKYLCEPTENHEKRITVKFTASIGVVREILRHRKFSFLNESTRYCNYSKDKFGNELTFIIPQWIYDLQRKQAEYMDYATCMPKSWLLNMKDQQLVEQLVVQDRHTAAWYDHLRFCEEDYLYLIGDNDGYQLKPEEARGILPLDLKSELIVTGFVDDWIHFFRLRSHIAATGKPHPDIQKLADGLMQEFIDRGYCTYEQIKNAEDTVLDTI